MSNKPNFAKMRRNPLKEQYDKMVEKHSQKCDNRCNVYTCRSCGHQVKTVDEDFGVTPMFISCGQCKEMMNSAMYNDTLPNERPTKCWYRPSFAEFQSLNKYEHEHVLKGGLLLKDIKFV